MKKVMLVLVLAALTISLTGCGGSDTKAKMPSAPQKYDPALKDGAPPPGREAAGKRDGEGGRGGRPSN
jgi:predicted small lipoprotein YifL